MTDGMYFEPEHENEGFLLFLILIVSFLLIIAALAMVYFMDALDHLLQLQPWKKSREQFYIGFPPTITDIISFFLGGLQMRQQ